MKNPDYLLELLTKDNLSAKEKEELDNMLGSDPEARALYDTYKKVEYSFVEGGHIKSRLLDEYVLYKNGNPEGQNNILAHIPFIEKHLRECSKCSDDFMMLNNEYNDVDLFISESLPAEAENLQQNPTVNPPESLKAALLKKNKSAFLSGNKFHFARIAFSVILLFTVVYSGLYVISASSTPKEQKYAAIYDKTDFYITRGRATNDFQKSILAIQNNDYETAIRFLKDDIKTNQSDETIFYTYYVLGLTYLESAGSDFLGLFPSYDQDKVRAGINYLEECARRNDSGKYPNINYDSYYFTGKAYLMLNKPAEAAKYFSLVIKNKGSRIGESQEILRNIGAQ